MKLFVQRFSQKLICSFSRQAKRRLEFRLDGFGEIVAFEISGVESQRILNVVGFHRNDDFRVVNFYARNRMIDN